MTHKFSSLICIEILMMKEIKFDQVIRNFASLKVRKMQCVLILKDLISNEALKLFYLVYII